MNFETILAGVPDYAKDIKLNLSSLINNHSPLTESQFAGSVLAAALACKNSALAKYVNEAVATQLAANELNAVHSAVAVMGMTIIVNQ